MKPDPQSTNRNLAVFPASLLKDGRSQQLAASQAASRGYLLVSTLDNPKQTMLVLRLGHSLKQQGQRVSVLSI